MLPEAINVRSFTYREANLVRVTIENAGDCEGSGHFWSSSNEVSDPAVVKLVGYQNAMWWPHQAEDADARKHVHHTRGSDRVLGDSPTRAGPFGTDGHAAARQVQGRLTVTGIFTSDLHAGTESTVRVQAQNIGTCDAWGTISLIPVHPEGAAPKSTPAESPQLFIPKDESATFDFKVTPADNNVLEFHGCAEAIDPADAVNSNRCSTRTITMNEAGGYVAPRIPRPTR